MFKNHRRRRKNRATYKLIEPHFDRDYYLRTYTDVRRDGMDPVEHYILHGHKELRNPRADFDTASYISQYPDVALAGVNPFLHYVRHGRGEGRNSGLSLPDGTPQRDGKSTKPASVPLHIKFPRLADRLSEGNPAFNVANLSCRRRSDKGCDWLDLISVSSLAEKSRGVGSGASVIDEMLVDHILDKVQGKILSLDIWDTALRRRCFPDETKLRSARALWLRHRRELSLLRKTHPVDLFQLRRAAEAIAADEHFEYRMGDVAEIMRSIIDPDKKLRSGNFVREFTDLEIAIERAASYPDETVREVVRRFDGRKIAVSDFYLTGDNLKDLLDGNGFGNLNAVYASSDYMKTKREGALFGLVCERERAAPSEIVHIGDRHDADVEMARKNGLAAVHYSSPADIRRVASMEDAFWKYVGGDSSAHHAKILSLIGCDIEDKQSLSEMAIVVAGFVLHIIEEAISRSVKTVFFCTREGQFFKNIYDNFVKTDVFDIGIYPESAILEVSRRATFAASMEDFSVPELMRLWTQYSTQSLRSLAMSINVDVEGWIEPAQKHGVDLDKLIRFPWADDAFKRFADDPKVKEHARRSIWAQRANLTEYLEVAGFVPGEVESRLIVDIGWRGTIQDNLARVVSGSVHGCYLALERFLNVQASNVSKSGYIMDLNNGTGIRISEHAGLEFLFNAPGGSVIGYKSGKSIRHIIDSEENLVQTSIALLQDEIGRKASSVAEYVRTHGLVSDDIAPLAREVVRRYCDTPPDEVVDAFFRLEHNESFGVGATDVMSQRAAGLAGLAELSGANLHGELQRVFDGIRWHSAYFQTPAFKKFTDQLAPSQAINVPTVAGMPAILHASSLGRPLVAVLAPKPIKGSGGHRTIYNLAKGLAATGLDVHLMHEGLADVGTQEWVESILDDADIVQHGVWYAGADPAAAVSTIWYSPFFVEEFWQPATKPFYFVQDFEALFNPVGDTYLRAERSFAMRAQHVCIGQWLPHVLGLEFGVGAASAGLGVDHSVYRPIANAKRRKKIAFLYQPEKFRRMPELSVDALTIVKRRMPDIEIDVYGSDNAGHMPFKHNNRGLIRDIHAINRIYNESAIGLCISGTNPSRIPFEMMAAGCVPVDIYRYNNLFDYESGCGLLAYHSPDALAEAMCRLLEDEELCRGRADNGLRSVQNRSLKWETDAAVNAIIWGLEGGNFDELDIPRPSYTDDAVMSAVEDSAAIRHFVKRQWSLATAGRT